MHRSVLILDYFSHVDFIDKFIASPQGQGHQRQHETITVDLYHQTHPIKFPVGRKPEKTRRFRQSVDCVLFSHDN